jgi:hypothetical protein
MHSLLFGFGETTEYDIEPKHDRFRMQFPYVTQADLPTGHIGSDFLAQARGFQ